MNRTQKKCLIISVGLHLLLPAVALVGSGFFNRPKVDNSPTIDFIPNKTVDDLISGGGDNTVKTPPAQLVVPPAPQTPQTPVVERTPTPPTQAKPDPIPVEPPAHPATSHTRHLDVDTSHPVVRNSADLKAQRDAAKAREAAQRRQIADAVGKAANGIREGVSSGTEIKVQPGPGGGGPTYANFNSVLKRVYMEAWAVPSGAPNVTVRVSVTIAKDGSVVSSRILEQSGDAAVDTSVEMTLDRVKFVAPLPDSATEDQRTVNIVFDVKAKLLG
jgi:protein TonB